MTDGRVGFSCLTCEESMDAPDNAFGRAMRDEFAKMHAHEPTPDIAEVVEELAAAEDRDCPDCGGSGEVWHMDQLAGSPCTMEKCGRCGGTGAVS